MKQFEAYRSRIESALLSQLSSLGEIPSRLKDAMAYSLSAGGKRLRPVLLVAACEAAGGDGEAALPFACALEMIHTYSLIHDDLPAMDNDDLRRGKPTSHKVFGEAMAILAGDGLLNGAMELMLNAAEGMADMRGVRAARMIAQRAGVTGMIAGQVIDVTCEGEQPTEERVQYIHAHKTADLLTAPVEAGLTLAGASEASVEAGRCYAYHLGMAFQMIDDVLDVTGDAALLGKSTGKDAAEGKQTWVALRGVENARADAAAMIDRACAALDQLPFDTSFFRTLAETTINRVQ